MKVLKNEVKDLKEEQTMVKAAPHRWQSQYKK